MNVQGVRDITDLEDTVKYTDGAGVSPRTCPFRLKGRGCVKESNKCFAEPYSYSTNTKDTD